jgi:nucleolar protein 14
MERQKQKEMDDDMRMELDEGLEELRELLNPASALPSSSVFSRTAPAPAAEDETAASKPAGDDLKKADNEHDYDQHVRSLAFDRRAKPKDRTKTEEEVVKEEAEKLEAAEKARLRRMRGEETDEEDAQERDGPISRRKRRKGKDRDSDDERPSRKMPEGDDLEDDFYDEGVDAATAYGLGKGIRGVDSDEGSELDEDEDEDEDEGDEEDEDEEDEESDEGEDGDEDLDDLDSDEEADVSDSDDETLVKKPKKSKKFNGVQKKEVPFTFPCPTSHDDLLEIMDGLEDKDIVLVVKRIRTLYHPSRGEGNKERLLDLLGILIDHILYLTSDAINMSIVSGLMPHFAALVKLDPLSAAEHFKSKLDIMQKNLAKGLARGATLAESRTFPGPAELTFLRIIGLTWSTSDFSHPVGAPAELLMGQYLSQARVRSLKDVASGLFLCSIFLQVCVSSLSIHMITTDDIPSSSKPIQSV